MLETLIVVNDFKQALLISGNLKEKLETTSFTFTEMDSIILKGKKEIVEIYGVEQSFNSNY